MENELYQPNIWNCDKKIPENYNALIIPEIERETKRIMGDHIKLSIYNALISLYNKGKLAGKIETISIYSDGETKNVYYEITDKKIIIKIK